MKKQGGDTPIVLMPSAYNALVESHDDYEQRKRLGAGRQAKHGQLRTDLISVRNNSGGNLARGSVLQVSTNLLTGVFNESALWFAGITPTGTNGCGILRFPTASGQIGELHVSGCCIARVLVNDISHRYADATVGQTYLTSAATGPIEILSIVTGTGPQECVVVLRVGTAGGTRNVVEFIDPGIYVDGGSSYLGYVATGTSYMYFFADAYGDYANLGITHDTAENTVANGNFTVVSDGRYQFDLNAVVDRYSSGGHTFAGSTVSDIINYLNNFPQAIFAIYLEKKESGGAWGPIDEESRALSITLLSIADTGSGSYSLSAQFTASLHAGDKLRIRPAVTQLNSESDARFVVEDMWLIVERLGDPVETVALYP